MKGVIYARYSSDSQREESIEGQIRECMEYAERNGITVLSSYIDRALSAKTDNRPEFQHMIKDSAKHLFDVVIVWKLDRFARNRYDSAHYKAILRRNGVKVVSAKEAIAEDSTGILLESLLEGYAEFYSAELSEKVTRGLTENALKQRYNGGGVPVGYIIDENKHYQIDPLAAPLVLEAFTRYSEGATIKQLVDWLNAQGIQSCRKRPMRIDCVNRLLRNRRYIGEYRYNDIVEPDTIPAIVPKDLFERVQERLVKNKKAPARFKAVEERYLLTTKLFCGKCGAYMVGESGTSHTGKFHQYYKCVTAKKKQGCKKKTVRKEWIEDIVVAETLAMLQDDNILLYIIDTAMELQARENTTLPHLKQQFVETERSIKNMLDAIQQGIFNSSTKQRLDELEQTKSDLEVSILQEEMQKPLLTREQIAYFLHRFRNIDVTSQDQRQKLIDIFVNAIYLYDDKIVFTFNYKDGTKAVTLDEVEGSDLCMSGAVFGPLAAILFLAIFNDNLRLVFYISIIPGLIGVILLIIFVREKKKKPLCFADLKLKWRDVNPSFKIFLFISIIFSIGNSSDAFLILRAQDLGLAIKITILAYVLFNLTYSIFSFPAGVIVDKIGARKVLTIGLFIFAIVYFFLGFINRSFFIWVLFPVYGIYMALTEGVSKAYISLLVPVQKSGTAFGIYQTSIGICSFFSSLIAGLMWNYIGARIPFYFGSITALIAAILFIFMSKKIKTLA